MNRRIAAARANLEDDRWDPELTLVEV